MMRHLTPTQTAPPPRSTCSSAARSDSWAQQALRSFKEAYRRFEDGVFLFNIGQCYRLLDQGAKRSGHSRPF
jgi:hypothetical protein